MIARRDVLRLIGATAVSAPLPFAVSPAQAEALLDDPITFDTDIAPSPSDDGYGWPIPSATQFANNLRRALYAEDWGMFGDGGPREWADYKQALGAVVDLAPTTLGRPGPSAISRMDETVVALAGASWEAGIRVGAQMEMLRQALMHPLQICARCNGAGRLVTFTADDERLVHPCPVCEGVGTVATVAV